MLASVIGRGGFLGSAVSVALNRFAIPEFIGKSKLSWPSENSSFQIELFKHSLDLYLDELGELQSGSRIAVFWCAGRTFPRSDRLEVELDRLLFDLVIGSLLKRFGGPNLHVIYASSAGGLYSDFSHGPFGPQSPVSPRTPYGLMKLAGEEHLQSLSSREGSTWTIARISNLYGPRQNLEKTQGVISKLAISAISKIPIPIFVPFDTVRNYIYVDDAAEKLVRFAEEDFGLSSTQLVASPDNLSLSSVLGTCNRVFGRRPVVVHCDLGIADEYSRNLAMRSSFDKHDRHTPFSHGLMTVWADTLQRMCSVGPPGLKA